MIYKPNDSPKQPKLVVVHFMVGNTAPYLLSDWEDDIKLASKHGIDGFALNIGKDDWQFSQTKNCFDALQKMDPGLNFKLFFSFDMSSFPSASPDDVKLLRAYIAEFATKANYLQYDGRALVSTFAGESSLFGCKDLNSAWTLVKTSLQEICPISFVPSFFVDPRQLPGLSCIDGAFNWNGCWPVNLTPDSPPDEIHNPKLDSDIAFLESLKGSTGTKKAYMASVSPWFFTHYGKASWNKNWIYRSDDWLYVRRWLQLIGMYSDVDIIQIISWNDYGESHYIGPIKGAQPNSQDWVDGFNHLPWLHLCAYFANQFKLTENTNQQKIIQNRFNKQCITYLSPKIDEDRIYVWARPHPRDAMALSDSVGRPTGWQLTDDKFWVTILAKEPAQVTLWSESAPIETCAYGKTIERKDYHQIPAGLSMCSCQLIPGSGMHVELSRGGSTQLQYNSSAEDYVFQPVPKKYNFNAYVAMSPDSD